MRATNMASAADRISRRFAEDGQRRPWNAAVERPEPGRPSAADHRFDVVRGGREAEEPDRAEPPAARTFASARPVSWTPVSAAGQSAGVEQYRRLAASLIHAQAQHGIKVVMITSSVASEGKSLTAANLAVTLSRSYTRRTLLIDCDQRDPSQHGIFNVDNARGLTDYLRGGEDTLPAVVQPFAELTLFPAGRATTDPMGGLSSRRMVQLLADAADAFDFVILDTPPATLVPDASVLAPLVDATVLVIAAGSTQLDVIERAVAAIGRERVLGTVLNRAEHASLGPYGYGYGYPART